MTGQVAAPRPSNIEPRGAVTGAPRPPAGEGPSSPRRGRRRLPGAAAGWARPPSQAGRGGRRAGDGGALRPGSWARGAPATGCRAGRGHFAPRASRWGVGRRARICRSELPGLGGGARPRGVQQLRPGVCSAPSLDLRARPVRVSARGAGRRPRGATAWPKAGAAVPLSAARRGDGGDQGLGPRRAPRGTCRAAPRRRWSSHSGAARANAQRPRRAGPRRPQTHAGPAGAPSPRTAPQMPRRLQVAGASPVPATGSRAHATRLLRPPLPRGVRCEDPTWPVKPRGGPAATELPLHPGRGGPESFPVCSPGKSKRAEHSACAWTHAGQAHCVQT